MARHYGSRALPGPCRDCARLNSMSSRKLAVAAIAVACIVSLHAQDASKSTKPESPKEFKALKYRNIGPAAGGRVSRVAGVPGDPLLYYAATASGGVWKSTDGGATWKSVFDDQPISSIGSIAVAPSDPNVDLRRQPARPTSAATSRPATASTSRPTPARPGSTSGSRKARSARWSSIRRTPTSPSPPCSATPSAPTPSAASTARRDGGKTLAAGAEEGRATPAPPTSRSIPSNPNIVFAGLWQARRRPWELTSGGPGSGLYVSRDGGDTWKQLTEQRPARGDLGQGRRRRRAVGRPARLRADRGGEGRPVPLRRRRRQLGPGQRATARSASAPGTTRRSPSIRRNPERGLVPAGADAQDDRRRQDVRVRARASHHGDHHDIWIDPDESAADDRRQRRRRRRHASTAARRWYAPPLPICAVLPRRRRQPASRTTSPARCRTSAPRRGRATA